jgi:hypothetical protein
MKPEVPSVTFIRKSMEVKMKRKVLIFLMVFSVSVGPLLAQSPPASTTPAETTPPAPPPPAPPAPTTPPAPPVPPTPATQTADDYLQGRIDGERDAKGDPIWLLGGFACGILGIGGAYVMKPDVPSVALIGKSSEYILGYTAGYQEKARNQNVLYATAGCVAWSIIYFLVIQHSMPSGSYY